MYFLVIKSWLKAEILSELTVFFFFNVTRTVFEIVLKVNDASVIHIDIALV